MAEKLKLVLEGDASELKAALKEAFGGLDDVEKKTNSTADSLKKYAKLLSAGAFGLAVKAAISVTASFESAISDLSAITGATGEDLEFLSNAAKEMGASTTKSAAEAAEAMKLVASAKPDLLENAEALAEVTREALTLAEAAGATLPEAANTLGASLNQFGAEADQASRFINVLAAGAKEGASEINETAIALKNAGGVAHSAGISFEETNAAIQLLSTVAIKGGEAGTNLRNVILTLQTQAVDKFKPSVDGLAAALKNLEEAHLSDTEKAKLFGKENLNAADTLIKNADKIEKLTGKLTDTSIAYDQASIKTNNMTGDMASLKSAVEAAAIEFGEELGPTIRETIQTSTELVRDLTPVAIATAEAIVIAFKPVTVIFEAIGEAINTFQAAAEASDAKLQSVLGSAKAFNKVLRPNSELLAELGINIKDIDPRNIDAVTEAMSVLNKHSKENSTELTTRNSLNEKYLGTQKEVLEIAKEIVAASAAEVTDTALTDKQLEAIQAELDAQADKYEQLRIMAESFELDLTEQENARFEREQEQFELDKEVLVEHGLAVDEIYETQRQAREDAETIHNGNLTAIAQKELDAKIKANESANNTIMAMEKTLVDQTIALADSLIGETAAGAALIIGVTAARAISEMIINTEVAAMLALSQLGPLGGGPAAYATIKGQGIVSAGIIAAQAAVDIVGVAHDGLDKNPSEGTFLLKRNEMVLDEGTSDAVREAATNAAEGSGGGATFGDVIIQSTLTETNQKTYVRDILIPELNDAMRDGALRLS